MNSDRLLESPRLRSVGRRVLLDAVGRRLTGLVVAVGKEVRGPVGLVTWLE